VLCCVSLGCHGDPSLLLLLLCSHTSNGRLALINPKLKASKGASYTQSGWLRVASGSVTPQPSFLDFISGGCELNFLVAIDFTGSNGDPKLPTSLHYRDPSGMTRNQYQAAIEAVGGVLEYYDTDKIFPVYGFGGCPTPSTYDG
jgi:hypothetical protein